MTPAYGLGIFSREENLLEVSKGVEDCCEDFIAYEATVCMPDPPCFLNSLERFTLFGIIDKLFGRLSKKIMESSHSLESITKQGTLLCCFLGSLVISPISETIFRISKDIVAF